MGKKWYKSKGIWVGLITLIYGVLIYAGVVSDPLNPELIATVLGVIGVILRFITGEPIVWTEKK